MTKLQEGTQHNIDEKQGKSNLEEIKEYNPLRLTAKHPVFNEDEPLMDEFDWVNLITEVKKLDAEFDDAMPADQDFIRSNPAYEGQETTEELMDRLQVLAWRRLDDLRDLLTHDGDKGLEWRGRLDDYMENAKIAVIKSAWGGGANTRFETLLLLQDEMGNLLHDSKNGNEPVVIKACLKPSSGEHGDLFPGVREGSYALNSVLAYEFFKQTFDELSDDLEGTFEIPPTILRSGFMRRDFEGKSMRSPSSSLQFWENGIQGDLIDSPDVLRHENNNEIRSLMLAMISILFEQDQRGENIGIELERGIDDSGPPSLKQRFVLYDVEGILGENQETEEEVKKMGRPPIMKLGSILTKSLKDFGHEFTDSTKQYLQRKLENPEYEKQLRETMLKFYNEYSNKDAIPNFDERIDLMFERMRLIANGSPDEIGERFIPKDSDKHYWMMHR